MTIAEARLRQIGARLDGELQDLVSVGFPADLELALQIEGIQLVADRTRERAHGRAVATPSGYQVMLFGPGEPHLDPRLRFTIAHEIAHCVIARQFGPIASTRSEYWQIEDACNRFAAKLLVPDLRLRVIASPLAAEDLLVNTVRLAREGRVSTAAAGRRLADWYWAAGIDVTIAGMTGRFRRTARSLQAAAKVEWSGGNVVGMGTGQLIGPRHPCFDAVSGAFDQDGLVIRNVRASSVPSARVSLQAFGLTQIGLARLGRLALDT